MPGPTTRNVVNNAPIVTGTASQITSTYSGSPPITATLALAANVVNSAQTLFGAYLSTQKSNVSGDGTVYTVKYDTVTINQKNAYSASTGMFTAPVTGNYLFSTYNLIIGAAAPTAAQIILNVGGTGYSIDYNSAFPATPVSSTLKGAIIVAVTASATVYVELVMTGSSLTGDIQGTGPAYACYFSGMLLPA